MLLDRGLLVQEGAVYRPTGEIDSLEVPETLHALVAARLDGLPAEERRLLQDAAVLGKTFTRQALAAVDGVTEAELDPLLASLARKEILGVQADPTSPEHGQYGFLQDLVRHVAYETLSKKERRARHLAAAAYLVDAFPNEDEITEVLAVTLPRRVRRHFPTRRTQPRSRRRPAPRSPEPAAAQSPSEPREKRGAISRRQQSSRTMRSNGLRSSIEPVGSPSTFPTGRRQSACLASRSRSTRWRARRELLPASREGSP